MTNKTILLATWDNKPKEVFTTIGKFVKAYPEHSSSTIHNYISRAKKPYMSEGLILERIPVSK